jgi:hypothetical protein
MKWVSCHQEMTRPRIPDDMDAYQMRSVAMNQLSAICGHLPSLVLQQEVGLKIGIKL